MLYEGIPTKKKEKITHPAPKHESVFGLEDTAKTLDAQIVAEEEKSLARPAPGHDAVFGKADREVAFREVSDAKRDAYVEGMMTSAPKVPAAAERRRSILERLLGRNKPKAAEAASQPVANQNNTIDRRAA